MEQLVKRLEARVTSLEDKDRSRESAILAQGRDVLDLQKENCMLQREIMTLKDERSSFESKVASLEDKVENLERISKDLSDFKKLRSLFNRMAIKAHGLTDGGTQVDDTKTRLDDVEKSHTDNVRQNKTVETRHNSQIKNLQKTTDGLTQEINSIHKSLAMTKPNMFYAKIKPSQDMVVGVSKKMDVCEGRWFDVDGWFDTQTCCLVPKRDCVMALGWRVYQAGEGELSVYLLDDISPVKVYLGRTTSVNDICQGVMLRDVKKGHKYWVEVKCTKGQANVYMCIFMAWVVG